MRVDMTEKRMKSLIEGTTTRIYIKKEENIWKPEKDPWM